MAGLAPRSAKGILPFSAAPVLSLERRIFDVERVES
jgi:hypothetical protein